MGSVVTSGQPGVPQVRKHGILDELGLPVLFGAAVLLVSAMVVLSANLTELRETYARVQNSNAALLDLSAVHSHALMMEMTYRGYLLTGDAVFLARGAKGYREQGRSLSNLATLFADDPVQSKNLVRLRTTLTEYQAKLASLAGMPRDRAVAAVVTFARSNMRGPLVKTLRSMQTNEKRLLAERVETANQRVRAAIVLACVIIAVAVAAGALGLALMLNGSRPAKSAYAFFDRGS
jgi:CHASE3 domain sensor protein